MEDWFQNLDLLIVLKLMFAREKQTRDELIKLETELYAENRFFPQSNKIIEKIDKLVDAPHRKLNKGSTIYRARTIDKYYEEKIFEEFFNDISTMLNAVIPNIDEILSDFDWLKLSIYQHNNGEENILSERQIEQLYRKYGKKGWWGYSENESDAPPKGKSCNGRINPKGISYLYAADNIQTAALEVRPVISQYVSIAEIEIKSDITLFDFTVNYELEDAQKQFDQSIDWTVLGEYFSQPNYSGELAYLSTQYISEYIKNIKDDTGRKVFDGLCFRSSLDNKGLDYVLFDVSDTKKYVIRNSSVYQMLDLLGNLQVQLPLPGPYNNNDL